MLKVLIVDDEPDLCMMLKKRLEALNYTIFTAEDGLQALDKVSTYKPDIIILDVYMPMMDGYRFLEELRKMEGRERHTPVIILTARKKMREVFDPQQIRAFIEKPFDAKHLTDTVDQIATEIKEERGFVMRALIVGMDWEVVRPLRVLLESRDILVFTALDGPRAIEEAVKRIPELIICPSYMAGMDVFTFNQLIRGMPVTKKATLVVYDNAGSLGAKGADAVKADKVLDYASHDDLLRKAEDYLSEFFRLRAILQKEKGGDGKETA